VEVLLQNLLISARESQAPRRDVTPRRAVATWERADIVDYKAFMLSRWKKGLSYQIVNSQEREYEVDYL
jgi:hypothetical protein